MKLLRPLVVYALQFPVGLETDAALRFLRAMAASPAKTIVSLEVVAIKGRVQHFVVCSPGSARLVRRHLQTHVPGVRLETAQLPELSLAQHEMARVRQRGRDFQLDTDQVQASANQLLASLAAVGSDEQVWWQVILGPAGRPQPAPTPPPRRRPAAGSLLPAPADPLPRAKARDAKRSDFGLWVEARLLASAGTKRRARSLAVGVTDHLRLLTSSLSRLHVRRAGRWSHRGFEERRLYYFSAMLLNVHEVAGLISWPLELDHAPGLQLGLSRILPKPSGLSTSGAQLGLSSDNRPVRVSTRDRLRHLHVIGPSGVGKSTLLAGMALEDMAAGRAVIVIDPKADLVRDLLARVPANRTDDVIVIDPTSSRVVGFNPLGDAAPAETRAEHVLYVFRALFADSWGPRTDDILRACLLTLTTGRNVHTLAELPLLLTHPGFRRQLVAQVDDPFGVSAFWAGFEALSPENQLQHIGPVLNKLRALLMRPRLRAVVGQTDGLNFAAVLRDKRIVLVPLSAGVLGTEAARLLGSLLVLSLWQAVQARARLQHRPEVFLYLDEFQDLLHLPVPLDEALVQARGLGVGLVLAHQHLAQLSPAVRAAVLSSARNRVVFTTARADAKVLADELGPLVSHDDLVGLPAFEAVARVVHHHQTLPPLTLRTRHLGPRLRDPRTLASAAAAQWGRQRQSVEAELRRLLKHGDDDGPVGRRRLS